MFKQSASCLIPSTNLNDQSDKELDEIECKLLKQLTVLKPNILKKPLHSLPMTGFKDLSSKSGSSFQAMMNADMTNKMWEIDELDHQVNEKQWENEMLRSMKA